MNIKTFLRKNIGLMIPINKLTLENHSTPDVEKDSTPRILLLTPDLQKDTIEKHTVAELSREIFKPYKSSYTAKEKLYKTFLGVSIKQFHNGDITAHGFDSLKNIYTKYLQAVIRERVDLIVLSEFSSLYTLKAAIVSLREQSPDLPVAALFSLTNLTSFSEPVISYMETAEALNIDFPGFILHSPPSKEFLNGLSNYNSTRGLPLSAMIDFNREEDKLLHCIKKLTEANTRLLGLNLNKTKDKDIKIFGQINVNIEAKDRKEHPFSLTGPGTTIFIGEEYPFVIIGERINPTNREDLVRAIENNDMEPIEREAKIQIENGAHCLDLNFGIPGLDQSRIMINSIIHLQKHLHVPLFIDSSDVKTIEEGLKVYNGKGTINSVNGKQEVYEKILPIAKKYGASIVLLALDKTLPGTASERVKVVEKMLRVCEEYGIRKNRIIVDPVVLSVATNPEAPSHILKTIEIVKNEYKLPVIIGLSNISFGLPNRKLLNRTFLIVTIQAGLDGAILNPLDKNIHDYIYAASVFAGRDKNFKNYISRFRKIEIDFDL